jgi:Flp pilus assembly pilin Flp
MMQESALIAFVLGQQIRRATMKNMTRFELLRRLDEDESGVGQVSDIMTVGLIVIPLVLVLVTFRNQLSDWLKEQWTSVTGAEKYDPFK